MSAVGWWPLLVLAGCGADGDSATGADPTVAPALVADAGPDVAGPVGTPIRFDASASQGDAFLWDFGDGEQAAGAVVEHVYAEAGNYTAVLQASAADGGFRTDSALAVAYNPPLGPSRPSSALVLDGEGEPWVSLPETGQVVRVLASGPVPVDLCAGTARGVATDGVRIGATCGDAVFEVDPGSASVQATLPVGEEAWLLAATGDGWEVSLPSAGVVRCACTGGAPDLAVAPDVRGLARGTSGTWASRYRSIDGVGLIGGSPSIELGYDPGPDSDTTIRGVPTALESLVLSPDEGWLYASGVLANTARGLYRDGRELDFETTVRAFVDAVEPSTGALRWRKQFDDHGMAGPMVLSEHGNWLFVGFPTTGDIAILDAYTGDIASSIQGAGLGLRGLQLTGDTLVAWAWLDREVRAWDVSELGSPALLWSRSAVATEPLPADVLAGKRIFWNAADTRMAKAAYVSCAVCHPDGEHDGLTWDFTDRGEGLRNTTSLLGRGGVGMGPLHWSANFDEVQDFEHDIRGPFGGLGFLADADWASGTVATPLGDPKAGLSPELDALAAYLDSLDAAPAPPGDSGGPEAVAGEAVFLASGCADCHPAPLYTDSGVGGLHDVGTLGPGSGQRLGGPLDGLDTPTLLGLWQTPPYLHDGSAPSIQDAIRAHDSAAGLADPEVDAIAAFLRSL